MELMDSSKEVAIVFLKKRLSFVNVAACAANKGGLVVDVPAGDETEMMGMGSQP